MTSLAARIARHATLAAVALLAACQTPMDSIPWDQPAPLAEQPKTQGNGAIFQPGRDGALFENPTARRVGDLLTIRLEERTSATKSAKTSTKKSTSVEVPAPKLLGQPATLNGLPMDTSIAGDQAFDGQGASSQSNQLFGSITVTVVGRVGNGNLLVRGQKWLALNQGKELVRVEGIVRPMDVEPDNSVASWKVAEARIAYGGRGAVQDANAMGWLARVFNSPVMPF